MTMVNGKNKNKPPIAPRGNPAYKHGACHGYFPFEVLNDWVD